METEQLVVNTLVFLRDMQNGIAQAQLFKGIRGLGIRSVEVRREFIQGEAEYGQIKQEADHLDLKLLYSVPDVLFVRGELNLLKLRKYFSEARQMGAQMIKFNLGDFRGWTDPILKAFYDLAVHSQTVVTVENDQTLENGTVNNLLPFFEECKSKGIPVFMTFDVGNWYWVDEDPLINAAKLAPHVRYIHLKDVQLTPDGPRAARLGEGVAPWQHVLALLSSQVFLPLALEYPCGTEPCDVLAQEIAKLNQSRFLDL